MKRSLSWLPALLWAGLIFWLSSQSKLPEIGPAFWQKDKVAHLIFYGVLGAFVLLGLRSVVSPSTLLRAGQSNPRRVVSLSNPRTPSLSLPKAALLAILITSAYGASDEFHQRFVPNRTCDVWDWVADTMGGALAVSACFSYESRRNSKKSR
jgi:VanZ family protein